MLRKLLAVLLCGVAILTVLAGCDKQITENEDPIIEDNENTDTGYRNTVLYYVSDEGFVVPVMKKIPWEEGIGKAALYQLVGTEDNMSSASARGLKIVLPEGVKFELKIDDDAHAIVNIIGMPAFEDSISEQAMVTAVVNTLLEFPTIETVEMKFDGKSVSKLKHGTKLQKSMGFLPLNADPGEVTTSTSETCMVYLYFPNNTCSLNVPVARYYESEPTFADAVQALIDGPVQDGLRSCFPEGTQLLEAKIVDGIAVIDVSKEFLEVENSPGLSDAACETICLTANGFEPVSGVVINVEGEEYHQSAAVFYVNEF